MYIITILSVFAAISATNAWMVSPRSMQHRSSFVLMQQQSHQWKNWKNGVASLLTAFTIANSPAPSLADPIPQLGSLAPDFVLPSTLGKDISLQDLKGKRTVLYFYPVRKHLVA
jgi:hypothetical protein